MDDKVILENILTNVKGNCNLMMNGAIESATPNVHCAFTSSLNDALAIQNEIYTKMAQKGWYQVQPEDQQKIDQVKQKFSMS